MYLNDTHLFNSFQIIVPALHLSSQLLVWQLHNLESASASAAVDRAEVKSEESGSEALLTPQIRNEIRLLSQRIRELVELLTQILRFEFKDVMYEVRYYIAFFNKLTITVLAPDVQPTTWNLLEFVLVRV